MPNIFNSQSYRAVYRTVFFIATIVFIFVIMPFFYAYTGQYVQQIIQLHIPFILENMIAIASLLVGGALMAWTLVLQYGYGQGSGSHLVPTQKLIVFGPYKKSRHPMLLGAVFFYLGTGIMASSIVVGLYGALITAILSYFLITYFEEPALIARFGSEYKKYQKEVPIIPFFSWKR